MRQRVRIRVQVPEADPAVDSITDVYPGADAMEREAYDLIGILFDGHPDLTRILMPEDWEGHPLRKDYGVGPGPGAVQGSAGTAMSEHDDHDERGGGARRGRVRSRGTDRRTGRPRSSATSWPRPQRARRSSCPATRPSADELRQEVGAVLRLPEGGYVDPGDIDIERRDDETMIINMGPQHPSTHGVLRLMLELDGETVLRTKPIIGYLHTGMEKTGRGADLRPGLHQRDPDGLPLAAAQRAGLLPGHRGAARASSCRRGPCGSACSWPSCNRVSSHLMWMATNGMDLGSTSMMIYGFREREMVLSFFEKTTGLRMNHNYIRPGGVAADLPDGWEDDVDDHLRHGAGPHLRVRRAAHRPAHLP